MSDIKSKGAGKKKIMVILAIALLLPAIGAGVWFSGLFGHKGGHHNTAASIEQVPSLVDLPDMVSNLDTGGRRASFVKVHIKLQVMSAADAAALRSAEPELLDIVQTYLRVMRPEELRSGEGTYRLREALMNRIDARMAPVEVSDLLFTQLLVQ